MKSFARKLYHKIKILHNEHYRFNHLKLGLKCESRWYGNHYGGFYLNPSLINEESIIYSFGIGEDISFDLQLIDNHKCHVYGFDPTPKSIKWCQKQMLPENFHFYDYGISEKTGKVDFHLPKNKEHVSGSLLHQENVSVSDKVTVEVKSINDIFKILKHEKIDVLKNLLLEEDRLEVDALKLKIIIYIKCLIAL